MPSTQITRGFFSLHLNANDSPFCPLCAWWSNMKIGRKVIMAPRGLFVAPLCISCGCSSTRRGWTLTEMGKCWAHVTPQVHRCVHQHLTIHRCKTTRRISPSNQGAHSQPTGSPHAVTGLSLHGLLCEGAGKALPAKPFARAAPKLFWPP